jgi:hypothetical protein
MYRRLGTTDLEVVLRTNKISANNYYHESMHNYVKTIWAKFHQHSTGSFYAEFLAMSTIKVGHFLVFFGETEQYLPAPKNDYWRICARRHWVGEIDLRGQTV